MAPPPTPERPGRRRASALSARVRSFLTRAPLTPSGVACLALGAHAHLRWGRGEADYVLLGAGALAAALPLVCLVVAGLAAGRLRAAAAPGARAATEPRLDLPVGHPHRTELRLPTLRWWPLIVPSVRWRAVDPGGLCPPEVALEPVVDAFGRPRLAEVVTPVERGDLGSLVRELEARDVFGLARVRVRVPLAQALRAVPSPRPAPVAALVREVAGDVLSHPAGEPVGDRVDMRRYAPGDPARHVLWKVFARTRQLVVRTPERALQPEPALAAFLASGTDDEAAASVAWRCVGSGALGHDAPFMAEGASAPAWGRDVALDQIVASASTRDTGAASLGALLPHVEGRDLARVVVFAPPAPGPWLDRLESLLRAPGAGGLRRSQPPRVLVAAPWTLPSGVRRQVARGRIASLVFALSDADVTRAKTAALSQVVRRLEAAGAEVLVAHGPSAQLVPRQARARLLEAA